MTDNVFISSIKIKGLHFLPPVITTKRRTQLQKYKHQAIKLEKRLQTCRDLRRNLQELLVLKPYSEYYQSSESDSVAETESCYSKKLNTKQTHLFHGINLRSNLSQDIVEITEYGKDGIKIIDKHQTQDFKTTEQRINICSRDTNNSQVEYKTESPQIETDESIIKSIETNLNTLQDIVLPSSNLSNSISPINCGKMVSSPPRLIRSNSYILENPSPILLAHLNELSQNDDAGDKNLMTKSSVEQNSSVLFENSHFNSISATYDVLKDKNIRQNSNTNSNIKNKLTDITLPRIKIVQNDISVPQIAVDYVKTTCKESDIQKSSLELVNPSSKLMEMLMSTSDDYSNKIVDLIENQVEQGNKRHKENILANCNVLSIPENNLNSSDSILFKNLYNIDDLNEESKSDNDGLSPSQSIYYTLSSTCTVLPSSPINIVDFDVENPVVDNEKENSESLFVKDPPVKFQPQLANCKRKLSFRQEIYKQLDDDLTTIKQEWAASVIGAHVKGYLTRRLLRTERVQSLINTIKDALICALQLHTADNIDESDVELHRRLINQVTAACYTFHDIFFSTSIPEQMSIISNDRQKKLEKVKRPASAPGPRQNRSATKLKPRTTLSQSLTKV